MRRIDWNYPIQIDTEFRREYGVVFACPLKERGGVTMRDYSGNRYDGTLVNGPTRALDKWGGPALSFAGSSYVAASSPIASGQAMTVSLWLNTTDTTNFNPAFGISDGGGERFIRMGGRGDLGGDPFEVEVSQAGAGSTAINSSQSIASGEWTHLVGTATDSNIEVFVNGASGGSTAHTRSRPTPTAMKIGSTADGAVFFTGQIANVVVASKAWTAEQVARMYRDPYAQYWQPSRKRTFVIDAGTPAASRLLNLRRRCYA